LDGYQAGLERDDGTKSADSQWPTRRLVTGQLLEVPRLTCGEFLDRLDDRAAVLDSEAEVVTFGTPG
jgi:hypothetical protein